MDQRPAKAAVDLLPQTADMLVDDVGLRIEMIVPDMFEQHRARHHPPFVAREIGEDAKFARGEVDRLAAAPHRLTEQIDLEIADAQPGLRDYRGAAPAQPVDPPPQFGPCDGPDRAS